MSFTTEKFQTAVNLHRSGQLRLAGDAYREVLQRDPAQPDALHLSGVLAHQMGEHVRACKLIGQAIAINSGVAAYHCNLAEALRASGDLENAAVSCLRALALQPAYPAALHNLAVIRLRQEQFDEAEKLSRQAISLRADFAPTVIALADALRQQHKITEAIATYHRALELAPKHPVAHANLGLLLARKGDFEAGLEHCRRAVELDPQSIQAHENLGSLLLDAGALDETLDVLDRAIEMFPQSARICLAIGRLSLEMAEHYRAIQWLERASRLEPTLYLARCYLAQAILELGDPEQAGQMFQAVLDEHPRCLEARTGLARARLEQGDVDGSVAISRELVESMPHLAFPHAILGNTLSTAGDLEAAVSHHRQALAISPRCVPAISGLLTTLRGKSGDDELQLAESLLAAPYTNDKQRSSLHFGLAQGYDGRGDYARAAEHMRMANQLRLEHFAERDLDYDPEAHHQYIQQLIDAFTPEYFRRVAGMGHNSHRPVFIVGMPRSGTTLTEQILASHPEVHGAGERRFVTLGFQTLTQAVPGVRSAAAALANIEREHVQRIAEWHLAQLQNLDLGAKAFVVDKMPENIFLLGWIVTLFPHARIIHCRRDVRDVALSCWITNFAQIRWANDLEHLASRINEYQRISAHYRDVLPVPVLDVDYEQMVADQEGMSRRMLDFVGLDWHADCLNFHQTDRLVRTASVAQVRQPIYTRSVARWKRYEQALSPLLDLIQLTESPPLR